LSPPTLVGGVDEEDCALEDSTTIELGMELEGDARVASAITDAEGATPMLSLRAENIVAEDSGALHLCCEVNAN